MVMEEFLLLRLNCSLSGKETRLKLTHSGLECFPVGEVPAIQERKFCGRMGRNYW